MRPLAALKYFIFTVYIFHISLYNQLLDLPNLQQQQQFEKYNELFFCLLADLRIRTILSIMHT